MQFYEFQAHPKIHALNINYLSMLEILSPKVFQALVECCESAELARRAIQAGKGPVLEIKKLTKNGRHQTHIHGYYPGLDNPVKKDLIYVNTTVAAQYEQLGAEGKLIAQVILHETVHWARLIGGKSEKIAGREAGLVFEEKGYGILYGSGY